MNTLNFNSQTFKLSSYEAQKLHEYLKELRCSSYSYGREESFNKFWSAYPKKEAKKNAKDIWFRKKLHKKTNNIISFVEKAKKTKRWSNRQYIPMPTTFLNQERWEDDLTSYGELEKKPYYRGDPMYYDKGKRKWYVINDGQFLEFAGSKDDIEYKTI